MINVSPGQNSQVLLSDDDKRIPSTYRSRERNHFSSFLFSQKRLLSRTTAATAATKKREKREERPTTCERQRERRDSNDTQETKREERLSTQERE